MLETETLLAELAILLVAVTAIGALALLLRQPLIIAFIVVGIAAGPTYLDLMGDVETWELFSTLGIAILLFVVGLRLDLSEIKATGPIALTTGVGQMVFTSLVGFGISLALGFGMVPSIYIAVALTFSSTIIIVKLLSDQREIDSLHGRIAIGLLIVQDIVVVLAMIGISAIGTGAEGESIGREAVLVLVRGVGFVAGVAVLMRYVLPRAFDLFARSTELMLLSAISWALGLSVIGELLGFSTEVGAFVAGASLASTNVRDAIGSRLVSLRDFLLVFFFLVLGANLDLRLLGGQMVPAILLSLFVLVAKPLIVMAIMGLMGYRRRTSFLAGITMAQISEFSLIFGALGLSFGHIDEEQLGLITLVGLITIGLSSYLILYSHWLYDRVADVLRVFEREVPYREMDPNFHPPAAVEVILFGLGRYGGQLARRLHHHGVRVMGIDFDPSLVGSAARAGMTVQYGDAEDHEFANMLPLRHAKWVISTMRNERSNRSLMESLRAHGYHGRIAVSAQDLGEAERLAAFEPDLVLLPFSDAAEQAAVTLMTALEGDGWKPSVASAAEGETARRRMDSARRGRGTTSERRGPRDDGPGWGPESGGHE